MILPHSDTSRKLITIVIPVYNEELNIEPCYNRLCDVAKLLPQYDIEFIFTDNCSEDRSFDILTKLASLDSRIRAFSFSRNFGYQRSIYTGLLKAEGSAAIVFDCDLQDPPELLPEFIKKWEAGYYVVYGVRKKRDESRLIEWTRKCFYRLINKLSEIPLPLDSGDFRLIDRRILDILRIIPEQQPYLRGIIASLGFKQIGIPYSRNQRTAGTSKFNFTAMLGLAMDGIVSHSVIPLKIPTYVGLVTAVITLLLMVGIFITKTSFNVSWPPGFTTITLLLLFLISINALFLGIMGEYIARMYKQILGRPITITERATGSIDNE